MRASRHLGADVVEQSHRKHFGVVSVLLSNCSAAAHKSLKCLAPSFILLAYHFISDCVHNCWVACSPGDRADGQEHVTLLEMRSTLASASLVL